MNEKQIKNIIRNSYLKILQREPDIEGLSYYIDLMKKGEINEEKLEHILRSSFLSLTSSKGNGSFLS